MRRIPIILLVLLLPLDSARAAPQSLYLLHCQSPEAIGQLLGHGVVVSWVEGEEAFAFADGSHLDLLLRLGCRPRLLEADAAGRAHYRAFVGDPRRLALVRPPLRLLHFDGERAVISVPEAEATRVPDLGLDIARLFHSPLGPPAPAAGRRPADAWPGIGSEARTESLVARISMDSLAADVAALQAFGTRRANKAGGWHAARWIASRYRSFGIADVEIRQWDTGLAGNVIATIPGRATPENVYVLGGHYDSYVPDSDFEPGADDNGSGTAAVLQCARVFARFAFGSTIRFIAFGGEELGLLGSEAYANSAAWRFENIVGMVNLDMIGYLAEGDARDLHVIWNPSSAWLGAAADSAAARFVPELPLLKAKLLRGSSDHESFWRHGYSAILFHEDTRASTPYVHTTEDVIGTSFKDPLLATLTARTAAALLSTLAGETEVPVTLESFAAGWRGAGVELRWELSREAARHLLGVEVQRAEESAGPYATRSRLEIEPARTGSFTDTEVTSGRIYWYRLALLARSGPACFSSSLELTAGAETARGRLVAAFVPGSGGPVQIRYRIGPAASPVHLAVYDMRGRLVRQLLPSWDEPGEHLSTWDRRASGGTPVAPGVYLLQLRASGGEDARKVVLVRR